MRPDGSTPSTSPDPSGPASAPDGAAALLRKADRLLSEGKSRDAAAAYAEILARIPSNEAAMAGRVRSLIAADQVREAVEEGRRYGASTAAPPEARAAYGEGLYRAGRLRDAEGALAVFAAPDAPAAPSRALRTLGLVRIAEGREDEGAALLLRALESCPDDRAIVLSAAGAAPTRARAAELLARYLDLSSGDDPDRIEGARGTLRLYRALGERPVWVVKSRPEKVEIPLFRLRDKSGQLSGFVIEMGTSSRKPIRLLLDSGSGGLFLVHRIAERAGLSLLSEETVFGGGGDQRHASRRGLLADVSFGELRFGDALVSTTTSEIEPTGQYHGVLGLSVFRDYRVTIDLSRDRLVLEAPSAAAAGQQWWDVEGQMLVEASAVGAAPGLFLFDTGAARSLLSTAYAGLVPGVAVGEPASVRGYGGSLQGARSVRGARLTLQGLETDPGAILSGFDLTSRGRLGGVEVAGYVGLDLLDRTRIVIESRARRVSVTRSRR